MDDRILLRPEDFDDVYEVEEVEEAAQHTPPPALLPLGTGALAVAPHHFLMVPHEFVDLYIAHLGPPMTAVWLYLFRRTRSYGDASGRPAPRGVAVAQIVSGLVLEGVRLDNGVGLQVAAVNRALKGLEALGLVCKVRAYDRGSHSGALYAIAAPRPALITELRTRRK